MVCVLNGQTSVLVRSLLETNENKHVHGTQLQKAISSANHAGKQSKQLQQTINKKTRTTRLTKHFNKLLPWNLHDTQ